MDSTFEFSREEDGSLSLESAVFQALGRASVCWEKTPEGIFDSSMAKVIGDSLVAEIRRQTTEMKRQEIVERLTEEQSQELSLKLLASDDAWLWAHEFCKMFQVTRHGATPGEDPDEVGLMIGWFANAMYVAENKAKKKW